MRAFERVVETLAEAGDGHEADDDEGEEEDVACCDVNPVPCSHGLGFVDVDAVPRVYYDEQTVPEQRRGCATDVYAAVVVEVSDDFPYAQW